MVFDDEDWPRRFIEALHDAVEIDERVCRCMGVRSPTLSR